MAVYYFNTSILSQNGSATAVGAAAYRHNAKMKSNSHGITSDFRQKNDLIHSEITLPTAVPEWARRAFGNHALGVVLDGREASGGVRADAVAVLSERLWNSVEARELRNSKAHRGPPRLALKMTFALPVELSRKDQLELARSFVVNSLSARGAVTDWVLHEPAKNKEGMRNPHIHATVTLRNLGADDWGRKNRVWDQRSLPRTLRAEWARQANIALERGGHLERIDHRSLVDQGIELKPVSYDRTLAKALDERGEELRRKVAAEAALERNRDYLRDDPDHVLSVVSAERTAFTEQDILDAFRRQGFERAEAKTLTRQVMTSFDLVCISDGIGVDRLYTTEAQMLVDANLMVDALELAGAQLSLPAPGSLPPGGPLGSEPVETQPGTGPAPSLSELAPAELDEEQRAAFAEMISPKRLSLVSGYAGAGKTRVIGAAAKVWKARGFEVLGGALSGRATQGLAEIEDLRAASLAAWEARWSRGQVPAHGRFVLFVDEAGMVGSASWDRVQHQVLQMGGKLIAVGDPEQLQPVLDSGAFGRLMGRIGGPVIQTVRRIKSQAGREATRLFATSAEGALHALEFYRLDGAIKDTGTTAEAITALADAYYANTDPNDPNAGSDPVLDGKSRLAIGYSGRDVDAMNAAIRPRAIARVRVDQSREINYGEIVRIDRKGIQPKRYTVPMLFAPGDRVIFSKPHRALEIAKS